MSGAPVLPLTVHLADGVAVHCTTALRVLPGRRWVLAGKEAGRSVVAKLFLDVARTARRDFERERNGAQALARSGVPVPELVAAGRCVAPPGWCLVSARLPGRPLLGAVNELRALEAWADTLARLHRAGLTQTDPHLGNFWWDDARVAVLDAGAVRCAPWLRWPSVARPVLARALAELPLSADTHVGALLRRYAGGRGWEPEDWARTFERVLSRARRRRGDRFVRKSHRPCREFDTGRNWRRSFALDRTFDGPELRALIADPDRAFGAGAQWLKQGRSAQVVRWTLPTGEVVVKRYLARDALRALRRAPRPSRAARAWNAGQRLRLFGVPAARPVALVEWRLGPLRTRAYLVSAYVFGTPFTEAPDVQARHEALRALLHAFAALALSHGDLKASNVLITPQGDAVPLDLDATRRHRWRAPWRRAHARDRARLLRNLDHDPATHATLVRALEDLP